MHWIDPSLSAEHPAPRINVTAKGGVIEDIAGDEAGPSAAQTGGTSQSAQAPSQAVATTAGTSKTLGIVALILGALGLIAGLGALIASRGNRTTA